MLVMCSPSCESVMWCTQVSVQHLCLEGSLCPSPLTLACPCSKLPTPRRLWRRPCR